MWLERLRERFTRNRSRPVDDDPRQRGRIISTCVLIAVVLWFTLSMRETYTVEIELPTQIVNLPEDVALIEAPPRALQVQVQGEGIELFNLRFDRPTVQIDGRADQVSDVDLSIDLPKGVTLQSINPRVFNLRKEQSITRKIPVELRGTVKATGTDELLYPPLLMPDSVRVIGARSIIRSLTSWPTQVVERTVGSDSLVIAVPLSDTLDGLVLKEHESVTLTAVARPFTEGRRRLRVQVTGVPSNQRVVSLEPSAVTVTYRVPVEQFDEVQRAPDFFAIVSYDEIRADTTGRIRPEVQTPQGFLVRILNVEPATLRYYERLVEQ